MSRSTAALRQNIVLDGRLSRERLDRILKQLLKGFLSKGKTNLIACVLVDNQLVIAFTDMV